MSPALQEFRRSHISVGASARYVDMGDVVLRPTLVLGKIFLRQYVVRRRDHVR
jgi:hypothetical protein